MKNINKIIRTATVGALLAVVFTIASAVPASAHAATYSYYGGSNYNRIYSTPSYYVSNSGYNYGYSYVRPSPIVITQPQVIYQQPQVVYQQPQVIYQQSQPVVYQNYYPLTVSCYANPTSVSAGQDVTWSAYASGGSGIYSYTWSGTNNSYSTGSTNYSTYYTPGSYTASVTVYSNDGQTVTQSCGYATVVGSYDYSYAPTSYAYNYPTYYTTSAYNTTPTYSTTVAPTTVAQNGQNVGGNLVAACFANKTTASVGTPVTWAVEVTGGTGQYSYNWSGTDGLAGTGASAVQSYSTTGQKNATVLITSGGQSISQACGDSVNIRSYVTPAETNYQGPAVGAPAQNVVPANQNQNQNNPNSLSANALFALGYIPWGWVAVLIIIILGATVFYLILNRHKA